MKLIFKILIRVLAAFIGTGLLVCGSLLFRSCEFLYTDNYHTQQQMYAPYAERTWRDSLDYGWGLFIWSLPALVLVILGLALIVISIRCLFKRRLPL
jgi:hypothetical protein